jgi:hypothetical protein
MRKAKIVNIGGSVIQIPKEGNGAMLFLEWLALQKSLSVFTGVSTSAELNSIYVRLENSRLYTQCVTYINNNLI